MGWESRAASFLIERRENTPGAPWVFVKAVTKSRHTVTGLVSGTKYVFRVRAVGAAGEGPWSAEVTRMAA